MHTAMTIGLTFASGVLFFINAWLALGGLRYARTRDEILEASGALVPAFGCVLIVIGAWLLHRAFFIVIVCLGFFMMVLGRAVYEWLVFDIFAHKGQTPSETTANHGIDREQ